MNCGMLRNSHEVDGSASDDDRIDTVAVRLQSSHRHIVRTVSRVEITFAVDYFYQPKTRIRHVLELVVVGRRQERKRECHHGISLRNAEPDRKSVAEICPLGRHIFHANGRTRTRL